MWVVWNSLLTRLAVLLLWLAVGGVLGGWLGSLGLAAGLPPWVQPDGVALGLVSGAVVAWAVEQARLVRLLRSVDDADALAARWPAGIWDALVQRLRRRMRHDQARVEQAEARLADFLSALQVSPNGVMLLDAQWRIEWFNQRAADHFGLDPQRDRAQMLGNLVRDPVFTQFMVQRDFGRSLLLPGRQSTVSRPITLSVHLHPYGEGRMLLLSTDVTALEQAEVMRRDFVANVSHEIRTPLTVLSGFIETLQSLELTAQEQSRYLALMAQQSNRMQILVSDLLTLSRLEGSQPPGLEIWTPAADLLQQIEHDAHALCGVVHENVPNPLSLEFVPAGRVELAGSASELLSAMGNLVSNAIRYTPAGGRIRVACQLTEQGAWRFAVSDTGPGIAAEHISRLTERFYRVDRSRSRETGGTGLGLAIVKHVIQRHGGRLTIDSTPGKGSVFALELPAHRVRQAGSAQRSLPDQSTARR